MGTNWGAIAGVAGAVGAGLLGTYFFPETTGSLTGGLLGTSSSDIGASSLGGGMSSVGAGATASSSIWSNPQVLSAGILAGTSLLGGVFGSSAEEDAQKFQQGQTEAELEQRKQEFAQTLALKKEELAMQLQLAQIQAGAARAGAGSAAASARIAQETALRQARAQIQGNATEQRINALQLPLAARGNQATMAQNTGTQSGNFFSGIAPTLMRPALRS